MRLAMTGLVLGVSILALSGCAGTNPAAQTAQNPASPIDGVREEVQTAADRKFCANTGTRVSQSCASAKVGDRETAREMTNQPVYEFRKGG